MLAEMPGSERVAETGGIAPIATLFVRIGADATNAKGWMGRKPARLCIDKPKPQKGCCRTGFFGAGGAFVRFLDSSRLRPTYAFATGAPRMTAFAAGAIA